MKYRNLSHHIWRSIEVQAKNVASNIPLHKETCLSEEEIELVNEFELKRLRVLIRLLEEESPS